MLIGQLCACVVNWSFGAPKNPTHPHDFFPWLTPDTNDYQEAENNLDKRRKRVEANVRGIFGGLMARQNG